MNPRLAHPNDPEYFRSVYFNFKPGEFVHVFELTAGQMKAIGRLRKKENRFFNRYNIVSEEGSESFIRGFGLDRVKKEEIVYFKEPDRRKYSSVSETSDFHARSEPFVFFLRRNTYLLSPSEMIETCKKRNWQHAPLLYEGRYNPDYIVNLNHGPSKYNQAVSRAGALLMNDNGDVAYLPNQYDSGKSGFKQWVRSGGYRR